MEWASNQDIREFHAHVYFDAASLQQARALCEEAAHRFGISMGRMHARPVGPHPDWSCQLSFGPDKFAAVMSWLALNRKGLVIFTHPVTHDVLADHRDHAIWMGAVRPLNLAQFENRPPAGR